MFCSSLRRRRDWAPALSRFANVGPMRWREVRLQGHDIAFPVAPRAGKQRAVTFRSILLATDEINTSETKEKLERLCNLNGGQNVAIILLLKGEDAMVAFMRLQVQIHGWANIPIIPISSAMDFPSRIEQLRQKSSDSARQSQQRKRVVPIQFLLQQCVGGGDTRPLPKWKTDKLMAVSTGFPNLAAAAFDPTGQREIGRCLGQQDGPRVLAFFTDGPQPLARSTKPCLSLHVPDLGG